LVAFSYIAESVSRFSQSEDPEQCRNINKKPSSLTFTYDRV
jgi:hypothetical protein